MTILGRIGSAFKALAGQQVVVQPYFNRVTFGLQSEDARAADLVKHFAHWVYVCVTRNASAVASVPLRLYVTTGAGEKQYKYLRRGVDTRAVGRKRLDYLKSDAKMAIRLSKAVSVEEVIGHPFLDLWQKVNPQMDGFEMLETTQMFQELTGDGFLYIQKNAMGTPVELWVLPPQYVQVVPDKQKFIKGYLYGKSKYDSVALAPDEVIHFKFPNPHDPWTGFSPLQGCLAAVQRKEDMDAFEDSLIKNYARPDFLLIAKGRIGAEQARELRERWSQLYGKRGGRGKPAVLDMDMTVKELGFSPKEMAFLQGQKVARGEIAGAFDIPVSMLTSEDVNRANADAGKAQYAERALLPRLRRVSQKLNQDLLPMFDPRLFVAFDNPVPEDKEFKLKEREAHLRTNVISVNEAREEIGKEPVPWGRTPLVPLNIVPLGTAAAPPPPEPEKTVKAVKRPEFVRPPRPELRTMQRTMQAVYRRMNTDMIERIAQQSGTPAAVWFKLDVKKWSGVVAEKMDAPIKKALSEGAAHGISQLRVARSAAAAVTKVDLPPGFGFDINNPEVQAWLRTYVAHFAGTTTKDLGLAFSQVMATGLQEGETLEELTGRVNLFFEDAEQWKALQIARSETSRAVHHGAEFAWEQSEVVSGKEWLCNPG